MNHVLPPSDDPGRLVIELRFVPVLDREDAVQEAWLAHLERDQPSIHFARIMDLC